MRSGEAEGEDKRKTNWLHYLANCLKTNKQKKKEVLKCTFDGCTVVEAMKK